LVAAGMWWRRVMRAGRECDEMASRCVLRCPTGTAPPPLDFTDRKMEPGRAWRMSSFGLDGLSGALSDASV
ncbi:MAG: hypothetical protein OES13_11485, partial [Acidimicrobiia bacterium]|nr:hypothetical protein [Acidimicrobiia bacterium]